MFKCNKPCVTCPYIKVGKIAKSTARDHKVELQQHFNCHTRNIIYLIECKKCLQQYLGESKRSLAERIGNHRGYVNNKNFWKWATGEHFNSKGHSLSDMTVMVIEKLRQTDETYRKEREKMHIRDFQAKHSGMNRKTWLDFANCNFIFWTFILVIYPPIYIYVLPIALMADDESVNALEIYTTRSSGALRAPSF